MAELASIRLAWSYSEGRERERARERERDFFLFGNTLSIS